MREGRYSVTVELSPHVDRRSVQAAIEEALEALRLEGVPVQVWVCDVADVSEDA